MTTEVTWAPAPREMRSPDTGHSGTAAEGTAVTAARGTPCAFADVSAACSGAPRLRITATAAVAPNAAAAAIRKPRLAPARIAAPSPLISAYVSHLYPSVPICLGPWGPVSPGDRGDRGRARTAGPRPATMNSPARLRPG